MSPLCRRFLRAALAFAASAAPGVSAQGPTPSPPPPAGGEPSSAPLAASAEAARLSLPEAVTLALERNFGLLASGDAERTARLRVGVSAAAFHPQLVPRYARAENESAFGLELTQKVPWTGAALSASARYLTTPIGPLGDRASDVTLRLTQPVLRGFGPATARFDLRNARRALQGQERAVVLARQNLMLEVTAAFYQVARQRRLVEVARQSQRRGEELRAASAARMEVGLASRLDVLRAELQAAQAGESAVAAQAALDGALEQFRLLLGLSPGELVEPVAVELEAGATAPLEPIEMLIARALENRLELQEARDGVGDAERARALARQNLLPQLDVGVELARVGFGSSFSDAFRRYDQRASVFVSTSYPVERSADRSALASAEIDLGARERGVLERQLTIEGEVRAAARNLERIGKSIELQQRSVELAEQQQRLANLRYQRGLASNFDVIDAEGNLVGARTALVDLLAEQRVAWVQLQRATGSLDLARELEP
ncbi:MAG: TolC family protein [Vicinamibacteria bacterium]